MLESRVTLGACHAEISKFNSTCEGLFVRTGEDQGSPLTRQDECELILRAWRQVKQRCLEIMFREKRALNRRVRSRKYTLRKQYQAEDRDSEDREALRAELSTMEEAERIDFTHNEFVKDYILGEVPSPAFYNSVKARNKATVITQLQDETTGEVTCEVDGMLAIVRRFYGDLYSPKSSNKDARDQLLGSLTRKLGRNVRADCILPISASEVANGLGKGKLGRSPGEDGCPLDLWHKLMLWDNLPKEQRHDAAVAKALAAVLSAVQDIQTLPRWFKRGVLTIMYKKDDPRQVKNYRPLSIMGADYRLYTWVLTQRLAFPLCETLGEHQTAFLPGRLIGDNVKLVQTVIDKYEKDEKPAGILFLDQEKAYDRVSHSYLWAVMRRIGLPKKFIRMIKALYVGGTVIPWVNGKRGEEIAIRSSVRQGDSLSCLLFDIVIEPLGMMIAGNRHLRGVRLPLGGRVKVVLYADDIAIFIRTLRELLTVAVILKVWERATGMRVNWLKSFLMLIGGLALHDFQLPTVMAALRILLPGESYLHLGIPVGVKIGRAINDFWGELLDRLDVMVNRWVALRLSQRARVKISTVLLMSVPRYAINHLWLPKEHENKLNKMVQRLVWGKGYIHESIEVSRLPVERGGFGVQDLDLIKHTSAVAWVARMERKPRLPWVQLAKPLLVDSGAQGTHSGKVYAPWKQVIHNKKSTVVRAPSLKHIWDPWWAVVGYAQDQAFGGEGVFFRHPRTAEEVLNINFWYFPWLFKGGRHERRGVAIWASPTWGRIASGEFGDIERVGDLYDITTQAPRRLGTNMNLDNATRAQLKRAVDTFLEGIPASWRGLLQNAPTNLRDRGWTRSVEAYQHLAAGSVSRHATWGIDELWYKGFYTYLQCKKMNAGQSLTPRIEHIVGEMARLRGRAVDAEQLWHGAYGRGKLPKCQDLCKRLLLGCVPTGARLVWLEDESAKLCPLCHEDQTIEHIFVTCPVAQEMWDGFEQVYITAGRGTSYVARRPRNVNQMIGLLAIGPRIRDRVHRRRYHILYSEVIWQLWKLYQNHQRRPETDHLLERRPGPAYLQAVYHRIMMDRSQCMNPRFAAEHRMAYNIFKKTWGEWPNRIGAADKPRCVNLRLRARVIPRRRAVQR